MVSGDVGRKEKFSGHAYSPSEPPTEDVGPDDGPALPTGTFRLQQPAQDESHPQGEPLNRDPHDYTFNSVLVCCEPLLYMLRMKDIFSWVHL